MDEFFGAYILDTKEQVILSEIDIWKDNQFSEQNAKQFGPLKVFSIVPNLPYQIHVLCNYGIFIYTYRQSLLNRTENSYFGFGLLKAGPPRIIRYNIDISNREVAWNDFGYAFL